MENHHIMGKSTMSMTIFQFANCLFTAAASPGASQKRTAMPSAGRRNRSWTTATLHLRWLPGMARQRLRLSRAGRLSGACNGEAPKHGSWGQRLGSKNFMGFVEFLVGCWSVKRSSDVYFLYLFVCIVWSNCSQKQVLFFKHLVSTCLDRPFELILFWAVYQLKIAEQTCSVDIPFLAHSRRCLKGQNRSAMLGDQTFHTFSYHLYPSMNGMFTWLSNFGG